jgi:hypothetical protein
MRTGMASLFVIDGVYCWLVPPSTRRPCGVLGTGRLSGFASSCRWRSSSTLARATESTLGGRLPKRSACSPVSAVRPIGAGRGVFRFWVDLLLSVMASAVLVSSVGLVLGLSPQLTAMVTTRAAVNPVLSISLRFFMVVSKMISHLYFLTAFLCIWL